MPCENSLLDHHPMSTIEKTGVPARYIAIAEPLPIERVPISDQRIPSVVSPIVSILSWIKILSEVILMILFLCFTSETG
jgi:hypothetical protein